MEDCDVVVDAIGCGMSLFCSRDVYIFAIFFPQSGENFGRRIHTGLRRLIGKEGGIVSSTSTEGDDVVLALVVVSCPPP